MEGESEKTVFTLLDEEAIGGCEGYLNGGSAGGGKRSGVCEKAAGNRGMGPNDAAKLTGLRRSDE